MSLFSKFKCFLFLALIITVILTSPVSSKRYSSKSIRSRHAPNDPILSAAKKFGDSYRKCLLKRLVGATKIWEEMQSAIDSCLEKKFWRALDVHRITIEFDHKLYFILPISSSSSCVAVRLNIQNDAKNQVLGIKPEQTLRSLLPQCKFNGAGLLKEIYYRPVGKFYKKFTSIVEPPTVWWEYGNGKRVNVTNDPIYQFMAKPKTLLEKIIKQPQIDYLWIHHGSALWDQDQEYFVGNSVFNDHSILLDPINVTVCQVMIWSIVISKIDGIDRLVLARPFFKPLILSVLSKSPFLLLKGEYSEEGEILSQFYVNTGDPVCVKKYLAPAFCQGEDCPAEDEDEDYDDDFIVDHE